MLLIKFYVCTYLIYVGICKYTVATLKYTNMYFGLPREGFPWPARPLKHTESNSLKHTVTTFKYMN